MVEDDTDREASSVGPFGPDQPWYYIGEALKGNGIQIMRNVKRAPDNRFIQNEERWAMIGEQAFSCPELARMAAEAQRAAKIARLYQEIARLEQINIILQPA
jgi:hypothetical protein